MKIYVSLLCFFVTKSFAGAEDYLPDNITRHEPTLHITLSSLMGTVSYIFTEDVSDTLILCNGVGLIKEVYDEISYNGFNSEDLLFNALGCGIGVLVGSTVVSAFKQNDAFGFQYSIKW